ncbi:TIGR03985 family CRISPR-associated protein [Oxynema aestuarii AP17]|jgi:CRISPR-associated protein (TIGR03985 family)|uniref:TIGR03985 family CRISPR-associated protein n=1 Tax=Oxynema aestuarii AP17 TaxID=2064643 RepID=A0A6H1U3K2_9CYAN|nr:TIGR03985 family CRISPR-associated protein [Oxynema aestuarii AP17]
MTWKRGLLKVTQTLTLQPTTEVLQGLATGQLGTRLLRAVRLWVLLDRLYGQQPNWSESLPNKFHYRDVRDRLFALTHGKSDASTAQELTAQCSDRRCICHRTTRELIFAPQWNLSESVWESETQYQSGLSAQELDELLENRPFATVHRSIRDDLKQLAHLGWLKHVHRGKFECVSPEQWPQLAPVVNSEEEQTLLNPSQIRQLLPILESVSFVQPNLEIIIEKLWENLASNAPPTLAMPDEDRIFIHLDYILSAATQDRVDTYQEQLERLWQTPSSGVVRFDYNLADGDTVAIVTYPVCLHYVRRAKYLSAYGLDPDGVLNWHNYRLDRIASDRLTILPWGDPQIPRKLKLLRRTGELPNAATIRRELSVAWGFNFYLPRQLLLMRFPRAFARRYVDDTLRHQTFEAIAHSQLPELIRRELKDPGERERTLQLIDRRSPKDAYYRAWIREGDINVLMRLRDWRPNGEVILPLSLREQMAREARQELTYYQQD